MCITYKYLQGSQVNNATYPNNLEVRENHGCTKNKKSRRRPTLPPGTPGSTIGDEGLNFRVRNGNGCFPLSMVTGKSNIFRQCNVGLGLNLPPVNTGGKYYGQAERPISTGKLNASQRLHLRPIKLVVSEWPSKSLWDWEILSWGWLPA